MKSRIKKGVNKVCSVCGKEFYVFPSRLGDNFCSRVCANKSRTNAIEVACKFCQKKIMLRPSELRPNGINFCSPGCVSLFRKAELKDYERVTPKSEIGRHGKRMRHGLWSTKTADREFSQYIRGRDGRCIRCGKTDYLQCSHFWPRANSATRYDPENSDTLCYGCHYGNARGWEHSKQGEYRNFKITQLGKKRYDELEKKADSIVKRSDAILACMKFLGVLS